MHCTDIVIDQVVYSTVPAEVESMDSWRELFNGRNLDGWVFRGKADESAPTFEVEDATIVGRTRIPANATAFLATEQQFEDFELYFEVRIDQDLNSGVQVRSTPEGTVRGAQVDIQNGSERTGFIFGQGMGKWLTQDIAEVSRGNHAFRDGEWNQFRVRVEGGNVKTWVNGQQVADTTHEDIASAGVIALQVHAHPRGQQRESGAKEVLSVKWRNIKVSEIN
ncbi:MAG: DUF1080 domain-containing protein [Spirulinaceae cyanobacterium RM2_2_10]|nr:DUF1080 domain-containing protein [Spirulinaceae cyanobacterium RM2_2_10]